MMRSRPFSVRPCDRDQLLAALGWHANPRIALLCLLAAIAIVILGASGFIADGGLVVALAGGLAAIGLYLWWARRYNRHTIDQWIERHALCLAFVAWDDNGVQTGGCAHGEDASFAWSAFRKLVESPDFLVLKMQCGPLFVSKHALDADALADLRLQFAQRPVPRKGIE